MGRVECVPCVRESDVMEGEGAEWSEIWRTCQKSSHLCLTEGCMCDVNMCGADENRESVCDRGG